MNHTRLKPEDLKQIRSIRVSPKMLFRCQLEFGGLSQAFQALYDHYFLHCEDRKKNGLLVLEPIDKDSEPGVTEKESASDRVFDIFGEEI